VQSQWLCSPHALESSFTLWQVGGWTMEKVCLDAGRDAAWVASAPVNADGFAITALIFRMPHRLLRPSKSTRPRYDPAPPRLRSRPLSKRAEQPKVAFTPTPPVDKNQCRYDTSSRYETGENSDLQKRAVGLACGGGRAAYVTRRGIRCSWFLNGMVAVGDAAAPGFIRPRAARAKAPVSIRLSVGCNAHSLESPGRCDREAL
jgi:hypothetical protein